MPRLVCPSCGRTLYEAAQDGIVEIDGELRARGVDMVQVEGVEEPKRGNRIRCPEHGVVSARVVPDGPGGIDLSLP